MTSVLPRARLDILKELASHLVAKGIGGVHELHYADISFLAEVDLNEVEKKKLMGKFQGTSEFRFSYVNSYSSYHILTHIYSFQRNWTSSQKEAEVGQQLHRVLLLPLDMNWLRQSLASLRWLTLLSIGGKCGTLFFCPWRTNRGPHQMTVATWFILYQLTSEPISHASKI